MKFIAVLIVLIDFLAWIGGLLFALIAILALISGGIHFDISPK